MAQLRICGARVAGLRPAPPAATNVAYGAIRRRRSRLYACGVGASRAEFYDFSGSRCSSRFGLRLTPRPARCARGKSFARTYTMRQNCMRQNGYFLHFTLALITDFAFWPRCFSSFYVGLASFKKRGSALLRWLFFLLRIFLRYSGRTLKN